MSVTDSILQVLRDAVPDRQVWDTQVLENSALADYEQIDRDGYVVAYCSGGSTVRPTAGGADAKYLALDVTLRVNSFGPTRSAAEWLSSRITEYLRVNGIASPGWGTAFAEVYEDGSITRRQPPVADNDVPEFPVVKIYDEFHFAFAKES